MIDKSKYTIYQRNVNYDNRGLSGLTVDVIRFGTHYFSYSFKGVFRGFHGQPGQFKSVTVLYGSILDYLFDPVTGEAEEIFLNEVNGKVLVISPSLLHGFYANENAMVLYELSEPQNKATEYGFNYKGLLTLPAPPIISERDKKLPKWKRPIVVDTSSRVD